MTLRPSVAGRKPAPWASAYSAGDKSPSGPIRTHTLFGRGAARRIFGNRLRAVFEARDNLQVEVGGGEEVGNFARFGHLEFHEVARRLTASTTCAVTLPTCARSPKFSPECARKEAGTHPPRRPPRTASQCRRKSSPSAGSGRDTRAVRARALRRASPTSSSARFWLGETSVQCLTFPAKSNKSTASPALARSEPQRCLLSSAKARRRAELRRRNRNMP